MLQKSNRKMPVEFHSGEVRFELLGAFVNKIPQVNSEGHLECPQDFAERHKSTSCPTGLAVGVARPLRNLRARLLALSVDADVVNLTWRRTKFHKIAKMTPKYL